ncbi:hypothetical protein [Brevundimonas diminuta]|uniref:Uncharacterized protein n=1 Tax=Brevundimonas diminuta TaxID=293 RepID=A0A410NU82_BREDI|nr:hypothetical protein [Brevundimonas diminuta]QAT13316.1 hypothetical protein EQG53_02520 [Brevundimonas diminuta]QQB89322.1 hypothetical protein I6H83_02435 [Brevundimonas diminuta]GEC01611.1 hypothetical protein BDI01nite_26750 [Brevundimonas diminuta]
MNITREQFIRCFNALKAAQAARDATEQAAVNAGFEGFDLGCNPLAHELECLLGELCRVREDDDGPWPSDSPGEDDLSLALHWVGFGRVTDEHDNEVDFPRTAEALWEMWEREKAGPFRPVRGQVINLADRRPQP